MTDMFPYLKKAGEAVFTDRYVHKASELLTPLNGELEPSVILVGAPLSKSSISHSGALFAPTVIRKMLQSYSTYSVAANVDLKEIKLADYGDIVMHPTDIISSQERIAETVNEIRKQHKESLLILLGGDHSVSYPSIKGFQRERKEVGVIQFDAHHDLRNLEDGGPTNGTPFRHLIDSGVLKGEHLIQIGIRDFSNSQPYTEYAREQGVTAYTMQDVLTDKMTILKESVQYLKKRVDFIYVSVDMDVLDQAYAPGCPAIGPGGMDSQTLLQAIEWLGEHEEVKALDIVEVDPTLDVRDMTSRMGAHVLLAFLKGKKKHGWI